jgi:hypothetical protein
LKNEFEIGIYNIGQVEPTPELEPSNPEDPGEGQEQPENEDPA